MRAHAVTVVDKPSNRVRAAAADHAAITGWGPRLPVHADGESVPGALGTVRRVTVGPVPAIVERVTAFTPGSAWELNSRHQPTELSMFCTAQVAIG